MDKPKPIRLKYIPTDMYAVRYFKEKPFIVPDGMQFQNSKNLDFSKLNLDFSKVKGAIDSYDDNVALFGKTTNCSFDLDKLCKYEFFIHSYAPFQQSKNINFEGQFLRSSLAYLFNMSFSSPVGKQQLDKISSTIENLKLTYAPNDSNKTGRIDTRFIFQNLQYSGATIVKKIDNSSRLAYFFPKVDMSKWNFEKYHLNGPYWFYDTKIFSVTFPDNENFYQGYDNIFYSNVEIAKIYNFNFKLFKYDFNDSSSYHNPGCKVFFGKNLGYQSNKTRYCFNFPFTETGEILKDYYGEFIDEVNGEESLRSMRYTLIEQSFDRKTAGYPTCTLYLRTEVENLLTSEEIAQITAKGFSLIFNLTGSYT